MHPATVEAQPRQRRGQGSKSVSPRLHTCQGAGGLIGWWAVITKGLQLAVLTALSAWVGVADVHAQTAPPAPNRDKHVVSHSRMFSVSGGEALRMGAIATRADEIRAGVCKLLGDDTNWKYAISIRLLGSYEDKPEPNPIRMRIRIIGDEPSLQIRIYPGGGIDLDRLTEAIITMTLYEYALRKMPPNALAEHVSIPEWLATGIRQAMLWKSGKADRRMYRALFDRAEMLSPDEILNTEKPWELDATSRQVYDVSCGVLIMCLLNREGGPTHLREVLRYAATAQGNASEVIASYFIELDLDKELLNKWWALELAALALPRATEILTPLESEKALKEALTVIHYDVETQTPRPFSAEDIYTLTRLDEWKNKLRPCISQLIQLGTRCFPGYRPIVAEYARALSDLAKTGDIDAAFDKMGPLTELRAAYVATATRGRDYLDWYEISHLGDPDSADFTAYLETMEMLRNEPQSPDTAMSKYLEDIEILFGLDEGEEIPNSMRKRLKLPPAPGTGRNNPAN